MVVIAYSVPGRQEFQSATGSDLSAGIFYMQTPSAGLHISLSIRCFSLICCNILYPDETGNGASTWCLNPRQVYYGQTEKSADGGGRYSSQDKEHRRPPAFMAQEDCSWFSGWCLGIIELSSQDVWTRALTEPRGSTENREYTETYGQPSVLAPFPNTAKSPPQDRSLPDKRGQLSLSFIPTDASAPRSDHITWTASAAALSRGFGDLWGAGLTYQTCSDVSLPIHQQTVQQTPAEACLASRAGRALHLNREAGPAHQAFCLLLY